MRMPPWVSLGGQVYTQPDGAARATRGWCGVDMAWAEKGVERRRSRLRVGRAGRNLGAEGESEVSPAWNELR